MSEGHLEMVTKPKLSLLNKIFDLSLSQRYWRVKERVMLYAHETKRWHWSLPSGDRQVAGCSTRRSKFAGSVMMA